MNRQPDRPRGPETTRRRRPNPRLLKIHRSYAVEEIARVLKVHKNTVRMWIKSGLPAIDRRRPTLVHGLDLVTFLEERRRKSKRTCRPGEIYCVRCRSPKRPAANMADYLPLATTSGNLRGICPDCNSLMHRRVALARLGVVAAELEVAFPQASRRIADSHAPSMDCDSKKGFPTHDDAQRRE
jgi:excisionase family DNA binding protein